jgi:hypothetical protein
MKLIPLRGKYGEGKFTKVSDKDFDFASSLKLYVNDGYVKTYYKKRHWKLHQLLVGSNYDHINGDRLDNQRENLRPATAGQQNANRTLKPNESGFRGVYPDKSTKGSWKAQIYLNGKTMHLGSFRTKEKAAQIRDEWAKAVHGKFARLNFNDASPHSSHANGQA